MSLTVNSGATLASENKFKMLPGAQLIVEEGGKLQLASGGSLVVYDQNYNNSEYRMLQLNDAVLNDLKSGSRYFL